MNALPFRLALVTALLTGLAPAAFAQTVVPIVLVDPALDSLSTLDCTDTTAKLDFRWTKVLVAGEKETVFLAFDGSCSEVENTEDLILIEERTRPVTGGGVFPPVGENALSMAELFDFATAGKACGDVGEIDTTIAVCVRIVTPPLIPGGAESISTGELDIVLDTRPPPVPTTVVATSLDSGLRVSWAMPEKLDGASRFRVYLDGVEAETVSGGSTREATLDGLVNGQTYVVTVTSLDDAGSTADRNNESAKSSPVEGTPEKVDDFFAVYTEAGGQEKGGCATGTGTLGGLALAAGLLLARRRRAAAALAVVLLAAPASAQTFEPPSGPRRITQSPQRYSFEARTGPWQPNIDGEASLNGKPFETVFGDVSPLLWRVEIDVDLLSGAFGRLGLGLGAGFWQAVGSARTQTGEKANDTVLFNVVPITPLLVYRADFIDLEWGVPLVPYVKAGYGFAYWATKLRDDTTQSGWKRGFEAAIGLQLVLNTLEADKAAALDQDFGINSTSLFVEGARTMWTAPSGFLLEGNTIAGGLQFSF